MILKKLIIEGFLLYKNRVEIDFDPIDIALVIGQLLGDPTRSNAVGKSSLFEAIAVCLFGKGGSRSNSLDALINDDSITAYIEVIFELDNRIYKKIRSWGKKKANDFYVLLNNSWELISDDNTKQTDYLVEKELGLTEKTFFSTIFFKQKGEFSFIEGDRKQVLSDLLNLDIYQRAEQETRKQYNDFMIIVNVNQQKYKENKETINNKSNIQNSLKIEKKKLDNNEQLLKDVNRELEKLKKSIEDAKQIKEKNKQYNELELLIKKDKADLKDLQDEKKETIEYFNKKKEKNKRLKDEYKENLKTCIKLKKEINNFKMIEQLIKSKQNSLEELKIKYTENKTEIRQQNANIEKFKGLTGICPILLTKCDSVNEKSKKILIVECEKIKTKLEQDNVQIHAKMKNLEIEINNIDIQLSELIKKKGELESLEISGKQIPNIMNELDEELKKEILVLKKYDDKIDSANKQIVVNENKIKGLEKKEEVNIKDFEDELADYLTEKKSIEIISKNINQNIGAMKNQLENIASLEITNKELEEFISQSNKKQYMYKELIKVFGKNGISKMLMKNVVPTIEHEANRLMNMFDSHTDIRIELDLDPLNKDGTERAHGGLDIIVIQNGKRRDLSLYSGGETVRIIFSILLSLAELLSRRSGKQMKTLIIDERISGLDDHGIIQFAEIINIIKQRYAKIFIITHIDKLKDLIEKCILVIKEEDGSRVEIYG